MEEGIIHYIFVTLTVLSVLGILLTKNLLYAAFLLVLTFLGVAGLFVLAQADFVAVTQLMIYIGGVLILLVFGIMLTNRIAGQAIITQTSRRLIGTVLSLALFCMLVTVFQEFSLPSPSDTGQSVQKLGVAMVTDYLIVFEVVGLVLLVALVGAATIARFKEEGHG